MTGRAHDLAAPVRRVPGTLSLSAAAAGTALLLVLVGVGLRAEAATRPGLWADEIFSLAMATGHSLEQPAAEADPAKGDFVQPPGARPAAYFRAYAARESPPAGPGRVLRAVRMSDTDPPLYYLLLGAWTRGFGTGDAALRLFSAMWAVLSLPLLWLLGRELGGVRTAWSTCVLFALSPIALYYSAEGRMYALLWFLALGLGWLTVRIGRPSVRPWEAALWALVGAAGLLTHYFFAFVWVACAGWAWWRAEPGGRRRVAALAAGTVILVLPWYALVPETLARWRVSAGWLKGRLPWPGALARPFTLAAGLVSGRSYLGGWRHADLALGVLFGLVALLLVVRGSVRELFSGRRMLLWAWLAAACTGPLVFDAWRHTTTTGVPRYVLAGLPAAVLLAALALARLPAKLHVALLAGILLAWLPGVRRAATPEVPRPSQPYREIAGRLAARLAPGDLVIVSSIPSGVIGVARYLEPGLPVASWVPQLGIRRVDADLPRLLAGHRRVALVEVTHLGANEPVETWLLAHARSLGRDRFGWSSAHVLYFAPREDGNPVFPSVSPTAKRGES